METALNHFTLFFPFQATYVRIAWFCLCVTSLLLVLPAPSFSAATRIQNHRYALVIGHNKGHRDLKDLAYAEKDARRFANLLTELGDFPRSQVTLLQSPSLKKVRATMEKIRRKLDKVGKQGMFLLYYSGHSRPRYFQMGAEQLSYSILLRYVRKLPTPLRVVIVDSCHSGSIVHAKGRSVRVKGAAKVNFIRWTRRAPPEQLKGLAILASSGARERSYESDQLRSSFFTSSLLAGLRGAADRDLDKRVSLYEVYQYARRQTMFQSRRHKVPLQRPVFRWELKGSSSLVLANLQRAESRLSLPKGIYGHCFLFRNGRLVHEFEKKTNKEIEVGVQSGLYQIQFRRKGWLGVQEIRLKSRESHRLQVSRIKWHRLRSQKARALGNNSFSSSSMGLLFHYSPMTQLAIHGFGLTLALDVQRWFRTGVRYEYGPFNSRSHPYQTHELSLPLSFGYDVQLPSVSLWMGVLVEPRVTIRAQTTSAETFINFGPLLGATAQLDWHVNPELTFRASVHGGAHLVFFDQATKISPTFSLALGLVWHP